jgi:hypothetical protein
MINDYQLLTSQVTLVQAGQKQKSFSEEFLQVTCIKQVINNSRLGWPAAGG